MKQAKLSITEENTQNIVNSSWWYYDGRAWYILLVRM